MKRFEHWLQYAVSPLVGAGFFVSGLLTVRLPEQRLAVLSIAASALCLAVFAVSVLAARDAGTALRRLRLAFTPTLLTASAFGYYLLLETDLARYGLIAMVVALLAVWFVQLRKALHPFIPLTLVEFAHLCYAMHVVSMFFAYAFAFGIALYVSVSPLILVPAVGLIGAMIAAETMSAVAARRERWAMVAAIGILAAELQASLGFLPTSYVVNAAVALILFVLALHVFKQVTSGIAERRTLRRHFALSSTLIVLVLMTAQWI